MQNPREFLRKQSTWPTAEGQQKLKEDIRNLIILDVQGILLDKWIQLWSSSQVEDVADEIFKSVDMRLKEWGLGVMNSFIAQRWFPARLDEVILQLQATETGLRQLPDDRRVVELERLGMGEKDWGDLKLEFGNHGSGSGLFVQAKKHTPLSVDWLKSKNAPDAADFIEKLYSAKLKEKEIALTETVVMSRFRHPMLTIGEWGDADLNLEKISSQQLGEYLQTHAEGNV